MRTTEDEWARIDPDGRFARAVGEVIEGCLDHGLLNRDVAHDVAKVLEGMDVMAADEPAWPGIREQVRAILIDEMGGRLA